MKNDRKENKRMTQERPGIAVKYKLFGTDFLRFCTFRQA